MTLQESLTLHHEATGILTLQENDWEWTLPPAQRGTDVAYPPLRVDSTVEASLGRLPRLELITGPYLQAEHHRSIH